VKIRWLMTVLCLGIVASCLSGCEGDDKGEPVAITGDSTLVVNNDSNDDYSMYFDGQYIGDVRDGKEGRWSVPSGTHKITAKDSGDDLEGTFIFYPGKVTEVKIGTKPGVPPFWF